MPWYTGDQNYNDMPCVREHSTDTAGFSVEDCSSLGIYPYASNPEFSNGVGGYGTYPYTSDSSGNTDSYRYYPPSHQQPRTLHSARETPYMWVGENNFDYSYPSYNSRIHTDNYTPGPSRRETTSRQDRIGRKRRAPTFAQRRAANIRERRRMYNLNEAFDCLRQRIPTFAYEKRLSRIETLRLAISYISFMTSIINGQDPNSFRVNIYDSPPEVTDTPSQTHKTSQRRRINDKDDDCGDESEDFGDTDDEDDTFTGDNNSCGNTFHGYEGTPTV